MDKQAILHFESAVSPFFFFVSHEFNISFCLQKPQKYDLCGGNFENWDKKEEHRKNTHGLDMESAYMLPDDA